jgi:CheY-like chemotaxis protein
VAQGSEPVTVVVGDDHPMYREGVVRAMKESGRIRVLADVGDGRAALASIREHKPAVALLDYRMPELDGLAVVTAVARDNLPTRVLLLSATEDPATVYEALAAGAAGYLTKESDRDEIVVRAYDVDTDLDGNGTIDEDEQGSGARFPAAGITRGGAQPAGNSRSARLNSAQLVAMYLSPRSGRFPRWVWVKAAGAISRLPVRGRTLRPWYWASRCRPSPKKRTAMAAQ